MFNLAHIQDNLLECANAWFQEFPRNSEADRTEVKSVFKELFFPRFYILYLKYQLLGESENSRSL